LKDLEFVEKSPTTSPAAPVSRPFGALCLIMLALFSLASVEAQNTPTLRKLVYKVAPKYPRELKQNAIGGVVRLSVSISSNGSVGKISPIGGNPILVDAATLAVRQWKYVPADHPSTTEVQLDFVPNQ
jgi:TonB family protein